jgi:hypothetical protein
VRDLAAALALPQAAKLDDSDGGPEYLQITAEVTARPERFATAFATAATGDVEMLVVTSGWLQKMVGIKCRR